MSTSIDQVVSKVEEHIAEKLKGASGYESMSKKKRRAEAKVIVASALARILRREAELSCAFDL